MDSVTHLAAGVLTPLVFRKAPRTAALVIFGIAAGELPDIDIAAGSSAHAMLSLHRGITHSVPAIIAFAILLTLLLKLFLSKVQLKEKTVRVEEGQAIINRADDWSVAQMFMAALLGLSLHVYLDCMTTFGTQALWPLSNHRIALPSLFIADFALTLPLLAIMVYCLKGFRNPAKLDRQVKWARYAIVWAIIYPLACFGLSEALRYELTKKHTQIGTAAEKITVAPVLFSPFYWKLVAENETEYRLTWVASYKLFNLANNVKFAPPVYQKPNPEFWQKLCIALPIFKEYDKFAGFITCEVKEDGNMLEYTFRDLRYLYSAPNFIMEKIDGNHGMFIMQLRMGKYDNKIYAWRYLERGNATETTSWTAVRPPIELN